MGESADRRIISYVGDISDIKRQLAQLRHLNDSTFNQIAGNASKNVRGLSKEYAKLADVKLSKLSDDMKGMIGTSTTSSRIIKGANGELLKLTETTKIFGKAVVKTNKEGKKMKIVEPWKRVSTYINNASNSISNFSKQSKSFLGKSSQLQTNFQSLSDINKKFATQLKGSGHAVKIFSSDIASSAHGITKIGATVQTADGKFLHLRETIRKTPLGIQRVDKSVSKMASSFKKSKKPISDVSKMASSFKKLKKPISDVQKATLTLTQNIARLAKRAILTIPLWMAFRGAMMGVTTSIKSAFTNIATMDKVLQKAKRNMSGTSTEIEQNFSQLKSEATKMSLETGVAIEDIITAFQRFATTGQDFKTSMQGARASTALAVGEFGNTVEMANSLAKAYKVLGKNTKDGTKKQVDLMKISALLDKLWKTNAFDVNELGGALERFASTASIMNMSMEDSIKLLATLQTGALKSTRAGRLLGTGMIKLMANLDGVSKELGVKFNPEIDNATDALLKVVDAMVELKGMGKLKGISETSKSLKELFGLRGTVPIATLTSLQKVLKENFAVTGNVTKFKNEIKGVTETTGVLVDRFHRANIEIGKALVNGVIGADDFDDSLRRIVSSLNNLVDVAKKTGKALNFGADFTIPTHLHKLGTELEKMIYNASKKSEKYFSNINEALHGNLTPIELNELISKTDIKKNPNLKRTIDIFKKQLSEISTDISYEMSNAMANGLSPKNLKTLLEKLKTVDFKILNIDKKQYDNFIKEAKKALATIDKEITKKKKLYIPVDISISNDELDKVSEKIIKSDLDQLKQEGMLNSQLLKRQTQLEKLFGIKQDSISLIDRELEKERAVSDEKRLQGKLGSEALKLYRIADKQGIQVAKQIGDVLAGNTDFDLFVRKGGKALEVFKKQFADIFEQTQAEKFYKGIYNPLKPNLRGGNRIDIVEKNAINQRMPTRPTELLMKRRKFVEKYYSETPIVNNIQVPDIKIGNVINVNAGNIKETIDKVEEQLAKNIKTTGTKINESLNQFLMGEQPNNR